MTHREVGKVLVSVSALYATLARVLTDRLDPVAIGDHNRALWRTALERLIDFRDRGHDGRFVDLAFADVQRDPIGQVESLYAALRDELTDDARGRMEAWWAASAAERSGPGQYRAEEFGLDPQSLAAEFAFYSERFDVPAT